MYVYNIYVIYIGESINKYECTLYKWDECGCYSKMYSV